MISIPNRASVRPRDMFYRCQAQACDPPLELGRTRENRLELAPSSDVHVLGRYAHGERARYVLFC